MPQPPANPHRCTCGACQALDRQHPAEGWQLRLLPLTPAPKTKG